MRCTIHHYLWFCAIALAIALAGEKSPFWYVPIITYLGAEVLVLFLLAVAKGKVKKLPKMAKKAIKLEAEKIRLR